MEIYNLSENPASSVQYYDYNSDQICRQTFVLTSITFSYPNQPTDEAKNILQQMQLMVSFKMSLCLLLFMYVLYSLCKIAFNYKKRDFLTTIIQILFGFTLLCISIGSSLIVSDMQESIDKNYTVLVVFCYFADFCFCGAVLIQLYLWMDVSYMIKYQQSSMQINQDTQKINFNRFERKSFIVLILSLVILFTVLITNAVMIVAQVSLSTFFIYQARRHRRVCWNTQKKESYCIIAGIVISFILKIAVKSLKQYDLSKGKNPDIVQHFEDYQIVNFLAFGVSEFFPIALWTALKAPEDFFGLFNVLTIQKFSIFQSRGSNSLKGSRLSVKSIQEEDEDGLQESRGSGVSDTNEIIYRS
eukprot:403364804